MDNKSSKLWIWISNMNNIHINHSRDTIKVYSLKLAMTTFESYPLIYLSEVFFCWEQDIYVLAVQCAMCKKTPQDRICCPGHSLTDCQLLTLIVMIQVSQIISLLRAKSKHRSQCLCLCPLGSSSRTYLANLVLFLFVKS